MDVVVRSFEAMTLPDTMTRAARRFADKIVRTYAVAALAAAGMFGAADALAALDELNDDGALRRARRVVNETVVVVLATPTDPLRMPDVLHERALLAVIAAHEAVALVGGPIDEGRLRELEETLGISREAAGESLT